jgi:hypothetical protein
LLNSVSTRAGGSGISIAALADRRLAPRAGSGDPRKEIVMRLERGKSRVLVLAVLAGAAALSPNPAAAEIDFGLRGGYYTDAEEFFLGAELITQISDTRWFFNPNVEFVFVDPGDLATLNLDVHYDFRTNDDDVYVWAGGGPAIIFRDDGRRRDDDETDAGLNLLAGVGWQLESIIPYLQGKILLADDSEAVVAVGVRF